MIVVSLEVKDDLKSRSTSTGSGSLVVGMLADRNTSPEDLKSQDKVQQSRNTAVQDDKAERAPGTGRSAAMSWWPSILRP